MKQRRKSVALLLAVALTVTSIQLPVFAEEVYETENMITEGREELSEVSEEVSKEVSEEVNEEVNKEVNEEVNDEVAEENNEEGKEIDSNLSTENEGKAVSDHNTLSENDTENEENLTGADEIHIQNEQDLLNIMKDSVKDQKNEVVAVLDETITLTKPVEVNTNLILDLHGKHIAFNEKENAIITVNKDKKLTIKNSGSTAGNTYSCIFSKFVNNGNLVICDAKASINIVASNGVPVTNEKDANVTILDKVFLIYQGESDERISFCNKGTATLNNAGLQSGIAINEKGGDMNLFYGTSEGNAVRCINRGTMSFRGNAFSLMNDGGELYVNSYNMNEDSSSKKITKLYSVNGGTVQMDQGNVEDVYMSSKLCPDVEVNKEAADGQFKMLGGNVKKIHYVDNLPLLIAGTVSISGYKADGTDYRVLYKHTGDDYKEIDDKEDAYFQTIEDGKIVNKKAVQRVEKDTEIIETPATCIVGGNVIEYISNKHELEGVGVSNNQTLLNEIKNAPKDGKEKKIYLTENYKSEASITEKVVIESGMNIILNTSIIRNHIEFAGNGSIDIKEGATLTILSRDNEYGISDKGNIDKAFLTNAGILKFNNTYFKSNALTGILNDGKKAKIEINDCLFVAPNTANVEQNQVLLYNKQGFVDVINVDTGGFTSYRTNTTLIKNSDRMNIDDMRFGFSQKVRKNICIDNNGSMTISNTSFYDNAEESKLILNNGTIDLDDVEINLRAKNSVGIDNKKDLFSKGIYISNEEVSLNGIIGRNNSKTVLSGKATIFQNQYDDNLPILMEGNAELEIDGSYTEYDVLIGCFNECTSYAPYAIVYDKKKPVLKNGYIRSFSVDQDGNKGFAIADANGNSGYFINAAGEEINSMKATEISNGIPVFNTSCAFKKPYIMMNVDESYDLKNNIISYYNTKYNIGDLCLATELGGDIIEIGDDGIITAKKTGYAVIKLYYGYSDSENDCTPVNQAIDFVRIEVTDQINDLTTDSFEGTIIENNVKANIYKKENKFAFGYNLKSSEETMTGANDETKINNQTYYPYRVYTDQEEFNKFFDVISPTDKKYDRNLNKKYEVKFTAKIDEKGNILLNEDKRRFINDVKFKMDLINNNGSIIEGIELGTINISVDDTKPHYEFNPVTLNCAYNVFTGENSFKVPIDAEELVDYLKSNANEWGNIEAVAGFTYSEGLAIFNNEYIGAEKFIKSTNEKVTIQYELKDYDGSYDAEIPVLLVNQPPKIELLEKSIVAAQKRADAGIIPIGLIAQKESDLKNVTMTLESNPYFMENKKQNISYIQQEDQKYYCNEYTYLTQIKDLPGKDVVLTFKASFKDVKDSTEFEQTLKLKLIPEKYSINTDQKTYALKTTSDKWNLFYDHKSINLKVEPQNYMSGNLEVDFEKPSLSQYVDFSFREKSDKRNNFILAIAANEKTKEIKDKKIVLIAKYTDLSGKVKCQKKIKINLDKKNYKVKLSKKSVNMNLNNDFKYAKKTIDDSKLAILASGQEWIVPDGGIYEKGDALTLQYLNKIKIKVPVKMSGVCYEKFFKCSDSRFIPVYYKNAYYLVPNVSSLGMGEFKPNSSIDMVLYFSDSTNAKYKVPFSVKIGNVKKVTTKLNTKSVTLYRNAPYYEAEFGLRAVKPVLEVIQKVECLDENFEVNVGKNNQSYISDFYLNRESSYCTFFLSYKGHTARGVSEGTRKVSLKVTYMDGTVGIVNLTVNQK